MFRNIAIIAHVDHGKTTLVDTLLKQSGIGVSNERTMDKHDLEQEKGITILSKCTGITWKGSKINIVDTPGHADFGGEVERIMTMVDGVALLICATEGPMTQTKFVLQKALKQNLKPIVIINKVDRPTARVQEVENEIFELFCQLDSRDEILDYPIFYASARNGWANKDIESKERTNVHALLDGIVEHVPSPKISENQNLTMLITQTESDKYFGKMLIGRINSGSIAIGDKVQSLSQDGQIVESAKIQKIVRRYGMEQIQMNKAVAGDIVSIAGFLNGQVTHTINAQEQNVVIPSIPIDPPMITVSVKVNNSPFSGKDGDKLTMNQIKERLMQEAENDVALVVESQDKKKDLNQIVVKGRGDLHIGILMERLRREGFEMQVTPPQVIFQVDSKGNKQEPYETVQIEIDNDYVAKVIEHMSNRKADYIDCIQQGNKSNLQFTIPSRGLIGFRSQLMNETKGQAILSSSFLKYGSYKGKIKKNLKGAIISMSSGTATSYGISRIEKFGTFFIKNGDQVYIGMVIGEHLKESDVELNPTKSKELNNIRTKSHEEQIRLQPQKIFTLEQAISYIRDDEVLEITPKNIRIRKQELDQALRAKLIRDSKQ